MIPWLLGILIFLIPTNLFFKFNESSAILNGLIVDYLIPKIYLSDLIVVLILLLYFLSNRKKIFRKFFGNKTSILLLSLLLIRQLFSQYFLISTLYFTKVVAFFILVKIFLQEKFVDSLIFKLAILVTIAFQSLLAFYQYFFQKSLYGYLFLGETNLSSYYGLAKSTLFGIEKILPYGTTAHPNILGGVLAVYILIYFAVGDSGQSFRLKLFSATTLGLGIIAIFLTQSISAILALILGTVVWLLKNKFKAVMLKNLLFIFLLFFFTSLISLSILAQKYPTNTSVFRRDYLNKSSISTVADNLILGVGLGNSVAYIEEHSPEREVVRFVQPPHNAFLLIFSEIGLLGLVIMAILLIKNYGSIKKIVGAKVNYPHLWIGIMPILVMDHYLISLQTGLLLVMLIITTELNKVHSKV
jgi:O-antigen ligase